MAMGLTKQQYRAIKFIREYVQKNGSSPNYEEIMLALGLKSKSGVARLVEGLEQRGHVRRSRFLARSIVVIE